MLLLSLQTTTTITTNITNIEDLGGTKKTNSRQIVTKEMLVLQSQWYANAMYHDSMLCFYESCSKDTLDNIVTTFKELNLLQPATLNDGKTPIDVQMQSLMSNNSGDRMVLGSFYDKNEKVLEQFVDCLDNLRKQPPVLSKGGNTPTFIGSAGSGSNRKFLAFDLPMLAKGPKNKVLKKTKKNNNNNNNYNYNKKKKHTLSFNQTVLYIYTYL
eukprot:UN00467